jgi:hypothetical protein
MNTNTLNREFTRAGVHLLKASGILLGATTVAAVVTDLATRTMGYSPPVQQYSKGDCLLDAVRLSRLEVLRKR